MSYVGKSTSKQFSDRYRNGKWWSRTHNRYLKQSAEKYGHENFQIIMLEDNIIDETILSKRESFWIHNKNSLYPYGYNFDVSEGVIVEGKNYKLKKIKTGEIIEINNLTQFCKDNNLKYATINGVACGKQIQSQGYCLPEMDIPEVAQTLKNPVIVENIFTGQVETVINLKVFAEKYGLNRRCITTVFRGNDPWKKSHKGWKRKETTLKPKEVYKNIWFMNPEGIEICIPHLYQYCVENNLCYASMYHVASKISFQYMGWKLLENKNKKHIHKYFVNIKLLDFYGNIYEAKNVLQLTKMVKFNRASIYRLIQGVILEYKGYKLLSYDTK